ncbi:hypothetical protein C8R44DRAFT_793042 [Mycena epipterygia]|nr:hypothetical protein C8R44DRAFT_793042 [Mycena epipterygia]
MADEMEQDDEEVEWERAATAAAIVLGAEEARILWAQRRKEIRLYLCRPQLLPNQGMSRGSAQSGVTEES